MLTVLDKAIVAVLPSVVLFINQKFGWHLDADPSSLTLVVGAVSAIAVYFTPNKAAAS